MIRSSATKSDVDQDRLGISNRTERYENTGLCFTRQDSLVKEALPLTDPPALGFNRPHFDTFTPVFSDLYMLLLTCPLPNRGQASLHSQ